MGLAAGKLWPAAVLVSLLLCYGCSEAAKLVQETPDSGVVAYLFKDERGGPMMSPHRREALVMIKRKCPSGFTIVREGETRGAHGSSGLIEGNEDEVAGRRWGLEFRCH